MSESSRGLQLIGFFFQAATDLGSSQLGHRNLVDVFFFLANTVMAIRIATTSTMEAEMVTLIIATVSPFILARLVAVEGVGVAVEMGRAVSVVKEGGWWAVDGVRWGE